LDRYNKNKKCINNYNLQPILYIDIKEPDIYNARVAAVAKDAA